MLEIIESEVCSYFNVDPEIVFKKTRKRDCVDVRHKFFLLARELTPYSFRSIGSHLEPYGNSYDHATVLHGCKKAREIIEVYEADKTHYENLKRIVFEKLNILAEDNPFYYKKIRVMKMVDKCKNEKELSNLIKKLSKNE